MEWTEGRGDNGKDCTEGRGDNGKECTEGRGDNGKEYINWRKNWTHIDTETGWYEFISGPVN